MLTGIILAKNEENNIVDCIDALSSCDEIIVIDDDSTDRTAELAKSYSAKVLKHSMENNFSKQRNYALSVARSEWVLFVDADERVSKELAQEIQNAIKMNAENGFYIPRVDEMFGKMLRHGELSGKKFIRLGRRDGGKWKGNVHETWNIEGKLGVLRNPLIHSPHPTVREFLSDINYYTTMRAKELYGNGTRASFLSILLYTKAKFLYVYFLKLGFLDGMPGFILSLVMTYHSFLVRSKLFLLEKNKSA